MTLPRLQAVVDVEVSERAGWRATDLAHAYLEGGARFLQVRAKNLASGPMLSLCEAVVALAREYHALVIVNDRVDVALLCRAGGVHVGQEDVPPAAARAQLGPGAIVGWSTHSVAQIEAGVGAPVSYLAVGPVFGTATKETGYPAVGLDLVRTAARLAGPVPLVAIGGVTLENARSAIDAGAASVAVISDLLQGSDPTARTRAFLQRLGD